MGDPSSDTQAPAPGRTAGGPGPLEHLRMPKILEPYVLPGLLQAQREREEKIAVLLNRIASGQSKISIDSGWNDARPRIRGRPDPVLEAALDSGPIGQLEKQQREKREAEFQDKLRRETMRYLDELAHTEAGFKLLSDLDASRFRVRISGYDGVRNDTSWSDADVVNAYERPDGTPSGGAPALIYMNPRLTTFAVRGEAEQPWMTERVRYGLYHELIHAWHGTRGTVARGDVVGVGPDGKPRTIPNAELQAVGLGRFAGEPVSENVIRAQLGKEQRPDVDRVRL
jgi:hypothetical protein